MPAIFKILIVFTAVLLSTRVRLHLGIALILGGVMLSMWAGVAPLETLYVLFDSVLNLEFLLLVLITAFIVELGRYITVKENADEIVGAVRRWGGRHGSLYTLIGLPAVIGLIPMPAGALFSAPFVEQTGGRINGAASWKSAVNYWFRHVWEYWWPLYPGVITAMWLFDMIPPWKFFAVQFLFTPVAFYAGYRFLLRKHVADLATVVIDHKGSNRRAAFLMTPIAVVLVFAMAVPAVVKQFLPGDAGGQIVRLGSVLAGLAFAIIIVAIDDFRHGRRVLFRTMLKWKSWSVIVSLSGVLMFKFMMQESGLLPEAAKELGVSGLPVEIVVALLPFVAGIVTGIALGFTGAAFPLVAALVGLGSMNPVAALVLAYGFGYMGMMLSPVHLCLIVTRDYFSSSILSVYRQILPCMLMIMLFSMVLHTVMRLIGW